MSYMAFAQTEVKDTITLTDTDTISVVRVSNKLYN